MRVVSKLCLWTKIKSGGVTLIGKLTRNIMASVKIIKVPKEPLCSVCGGEAKIYYMKQWWCKTHTDFGEFNIKGYCKKEIKDAQKRK